MFARWLLALNLLLASSAFAQSPKDALAPFLDDQVIAVVRIRPDKIHDATVADLDRKLTPAELRDVEGWKSPLSIVREKVGEWTAAGGGDAYVVVSFHDIPRRPPFVVLPTRKKAEDLKAVVKRWDANISAEVIGNVMVAGHPETIARVKDAKPKERPDLYVPLFLTTNDAIHLVVSPSAEIRRIFRETLPPLPPGVSSATSVELLEGVKSVTARLDLSAEPSLVINLDAQNADIAATWKDAITNAAALVTKNETLQKQFPGLQKPAANPAPALAVNSVGMIWGQDGERLNQLVSDILQPALHTAYQQAAIAESINDLKQIMLAMHNYHDRHKTFPPPAILSKDGKKLLSWRVAILPYLDGDALYKEFHLDEPWDSEHNRKLIPKMPAVFASNLMNAGKTAAGFTPYVVPVGEGTCFGKAEGVALKDITDGTSNTIGVVLAIPSAVEWTKPTDWEVDFKNVGKGWRREPADPKESLAAGFCDGSVRRIPAATPDETIQRLLQIADGQVIDLP